MTLVFIGFSFNDKDFCDFFKRTKDKIESQHKLINMTCKNHKENEFNHFAFIKFNNERYDELENILNTPKEVLIQKITESKNSKQL